MSTVVSTPILPREEIKEKKENWQKKYETLMAALSKIAASAPASTLMSEPIMLIACGHTVDKTYIQSQNYCPICKPPLAHHGKYVTNFIAKDMIALLKECEKNNDQENLDPNKENVDPECNENWKKNYKHLCDGIKERILCPVSLDIMWAPYAFTACGHTFQDESIQMLHFDNCPTCRRAVTPPPNTDRIIYNHFAKALINTFLQIEPEALEHYTIEMLEKNLTEAQTHNIHSPSSLINILCYKKDAKEIIFLNKIYQDGPYKDLSALFLLTYCCNEGQWLLETPEVNELISEKTLNHVVQEGPHQYQSPVYWLAKHYIKLLAKPHIKSKIHADVLNTLISSEPYWGESALLCLAKSAEGRHFLTDPDIKSKIGENALNFITLNGETALFYLTVDPKDHMFLADPDIKSKIHHCALNAIIKNGSHKGESALFWLCSNATWRKILAEPEFTEMISIKTFNAIIPDGPYKGKSAADFFKDTPDGQLLLQQNPELKAKILVMAMAIENVVMATALQPDAPEQDNEEQGPAKRTRRP